MSSKLYRQLQGLFSSTGAATSTASNAAFSAIKTTTPKPRKLLKTKKNDRFPISENAAKRIANDFKKSSESEKFRSGITQYKKTVFRLARSEQFSAIEDIIEHQKKYENISKEPFVVRLICLYGQAGMFDHALKLFDEMPHLKCPRTVTSFNALLTACVDSKKFVKACELFRELPKKLSIDPDAVTYNIVIKALCEMDAADSAEELIGEMEEDGHEPNLITFNTIIDAFFHQGKLSDAEKMWTLMESKNLVPNIRTYNSKVRGLVNDKQLEKAVALIEEMEEKGIKPDVFTFNGLIKGFCVDDNLVEVKRWYGEIVKNDLKPDRVTFLMAVPFACERGDFCFAYEMCKMGVSLKLDVGGGLMQRTVNGLVKELHIDEAKELIELVKSCGHLRHKLKLPTYE